MSAPPAADEPLAGSTPSVPVLASLRVLHTRGQRVKSTTEILVTIGRVAGPDRAQKGARAKFRLVWPLAWGGADGAAAVCGGADGAAAVCKRVAPLLEPEIAC